MANFFKENKEVKLELLTDVDMLLMVEKGARGGICLQYIDMEKQIINIRRIIIKIKKNHFLVFRWKQFIWLDNVSKTACKRF